MNNPKKHETLSKTELNEGELAHLRLYHVSVPEARELSEQAMQLYFDMQSGSEKE